MPSEALPYTICNLSEKPEVLQLLAEWQHNEWAALNPGDTREKREERLRSHAHSKQIPQTWVACRDSVLLGGASLVPCDMDSHPEWSPWLASVLVAPEHRGQGIGRELVRHVEGAARQLGFRRIYLFTPDRVSFYERLGWNRIAEEVYRKQTVCVMDKDLTC